MILCRMSLDFKISRIFFLYNHAKFFCNSLLFAHHFVTFYRPKSYELKCDW